MYFTLQIHALLLYTISSCHAAIPSIPAELTYLLPYPFKGFETSYAHFFGNGTTSHGFVDTKVENPAIRSLFSLARDKPFVSYSAEYDALVGPNPQLKLIARRKTNLFAYEAGAWDPENNEVWFTSSLQTPPKTLHVLNLNTGTVQKPMTSGAPIVNPSGGVYLNQSIYLTAFGNATYQGGIVAVDTASRKVTQILNTYFGERFNGIDDLAWVSKGLSQYLFFTDPNYTTSSLLSGRTYRPNAVYRFDPQDQSVVPVIGRADIEIPNGLAVDPTQSILYVTDAPIDYQTGTSAGKGTSAIYAYDITKYGFLTNKRLIGQPRVGVADGIKVDRKGRIWTGEGEGIVVRSPSGKVLGIFNSQGILDPAVKLPISNFAFAGRTLVILALNRIFTVQLAQAL